MADDTHIPYRVLARKYRPQSFDDLIGQDTLVRTLRNAIESGRIAHAFMLTGIRGVGKTTTARIIARALNYTGPDGKAGPTTGPADDCAVCQAIAEDRHPDVLEMDAASRTGVGDIREILDGVRYAPASARYKIYIIDEVHMLSQSAFNALLKTLEEPPPHVKFIFATTEIRKVPVTVLSRCQRFDLRRVEVPVLEAHYSAICAQENVEIAPEALSSVARAADGSVRDGLSLLDQAITLSGGKIEPELIRDMLGLSDRGRILELLETILSGKTAPALQRMDEMRSAGADPGVILSDLLESVHLLSRMRAVPDDPALEMKMDSQAYAQAGTLAATLTVPVLGRAWQILLKGLGEVTSAPDPQAAAEMVLIRLAYAADLPDPAELVRKIQSSGGNAVSGAPVPAGNGGAGMPASSGRSGGGAAQALQTNAVTAPAQDMPIPQSEEALVSILQANGEHVLATHVYLYVCLIKATRGRIEISTDKDAPETLASDLAKALSRAFAGERWVASVVTMPAGRTTLAGREKALAQQKRDEIAAMPLVKDIMTLFPGAEIIKLFENEEE
jgi:DNA polymerase-3 subunit gamma/tau